MPIQPAPVPEKVDKAKTEKKSQQSANAVLVRFVLRKYLKN